MTDSDAKPSPHVAGVMAKGVIETLEVIDIQQDNGEWASFPFCAQQFAVQ